MSVKEMMETGLPLNRKERFFTGTVFPMIVCKNNFENFRSLLSLLDIPEEVPVNAGPDNTNIQFFTEYSLLESLVDAEKERFAGLPEAKDTPDIVILLDGSEKYLIALEAKMYSVPAVDELNRQMDRQSVILKFIENALGVSKTFHYLLLPEKFAAKAGGLNYPVITWEDIMNAYEPVCARDYFYELLQVSLDKYDKLVSPGSAFGFNCEEKITGEQIYERFKHCDVFVVSMGREGGIRGNKLKDDISTGKWRTFKYETSSKKPEDINPNWFKVEDFVKMLEQS
jgi:hypothetical protein